MATPPSPRLPEHGVKVLLVDDQPLIGETIRRSVASEPDIEFHYCKDPKQALAKAIEVQPTVILQDLVMPDIQGMDLVKLYRAEPQTAEVPVIVLSTKEEPVTKAEAFAVGANDYVVKVPDRLELLARIRYHSKGYIAQLQRNEAFRALAESQAALANEVEEAAKYVRSLLPAPGTCGPARADWRFIPSASLGGDTFGYHMVDDGHLAFYLLDVVGHGVGAALLSVSVINAIRSHSLPDTDFRDPGQVITALNRSFQMSQQGDKYFTAWYGVIDLAGRKIRYSGGGHPPVLLLTGPSADAAQTVMLEATGPMIGAFEDLDFDTSEHALGAYNKLFLYSDGVFEIQAADGSRWPFESFLALMAEPSQPGHTMDRLIQHVREITASEAFEDDFSILELEV
jgi:sigma-B regulation protein RsbU (phosphoserine phosphatase)